MNKKEKKQASQKSEAEEIKFLKSRVEELEHLVKSIQSGEIDAIIIKNEKGETSIRTIEDEDQPYRMLVENMSEGACTLSEKGIVLHCNKHFAGLLKMNTKNLIGTLLFEYIPTEQHERFKKFLALSKLKDSNEKITLVSSDSTEKILLISSHRLQFGNVEGISIVVTDITELEIEKAKIDKIQVELNKNEVLFSQLADSIKEVFWRTSESMDQIIYVSPAYEKLWGRPVEEIYKNPYAWLDSILPEDRPHVIERFRALSNKEISEARFEYRIKRPDSTILDLLVRASLVKSGHKTEMIGIVSDITELKKTEKYLSVQCLISKILVESESAAESMKVLLCTVCENLDWDIGEIWLTSPEHKTIENIATWTRDDEFFSEFITFKMSFEDYIAYKIFVKAKHTTYWVSDIASHSYFLRQKIANKLGIVSALAAPVVYNKKAIGLVEFFSRKKHIENPGITKMFEAVSSQIGACLMQMLTLERLNHSLKEKEAMLKEIYHRVKNNLQVVSSLLNLQSASIIDIPTREIFLKSASRVRAMSIVHEMLYQSGNLAQIDMGMYIKRLLSHLSDIHHIDKQTVKTSIDADPILLTIEEAIPCGLIINEIISNVFKHAFSPDKPGELNISLKQHGNEVILEIHDNGKGFPPHFDIEQSTTLGMKLIHRLAKQLNGAISLHQKDGTKITLIFSPVH